MALFRRTKNMVEPRFGEQRTLSNRVEYNGARRGLVSANKEHGRTSFWSTRPGLSTSCSLSALFGDAVRALIHDRDSHPDRGIDCSLTYLSHLEKPCLVSPLEEIAGPHLENYDGGFLIA